VVFLRSIIFNYFGCSLLSFGLPIFETRLWYIISGETCVQVFFTLSGFLITSLLLREFKTTKKINLKNFFARRFIRLLPPLILFYIVIAVFMLSGSIQESWIGFLCSIAYVYNFVHHDFYTVELGHTWSLAVEEQFYLVWPLFIVTLKKYNQLISAILFLLICSGLVLYNYNSFSFSDAYHVNRWFLPAAAPILIGSLAGILNHFQPDKIAFLFSKNYYLLFTGILLFVSPLFLPLFLMKLISIFQAFGVSLVLLWLFYNQKSLVTKVLDNPLLRYLGKISYGIYVYQGFFLRTGPGGELSVQQYPLNIILVLVIAILSYEYYEKPILKLKKQFV